MKINNIKLTDYLGDIIANNVELWQLNAYKDNPNIISGIINARKNESSLDSVTAPVWWHMDNWLFYDIQKVNDKNNLLLKIKCLPDQNDYRDFVFCSDKNAITDFSGAKMLLLEVDASEFLSDFKMAFALQTFDKISGAFVLKNGEKTKLIGENFIFESVSDNGFLTVPAGFKGFVCFPLKSEFLIELSGKNCNLNLQNAQLIKINFKGESDILNKNFYVKRLAITYCNIENKSFATLKTSEKIKTVWDFSGITSRTDYRQNLLPWYGEFAGKLLTGMVFCYNLTKNTKLKTQIQNLVNALKTAQSHDGYLGFFVGCSKFSLFTDNWDLWNHYHAVIGLIEWYKTSGDKTAFEVAEKTLNLILQTFKNRSYLTYGGFETSRSIAHAYAEFYLITKNKKYLNEAERIILQDCQDQNGWYKTALKGGSFYTTSCTRWEVLHMIMTLGILYRETKNQEYKEVLENVWKDICKLDVHNTGGFTTNEGAKGNPYMDGVIETCCTIAWMALTNEYLFNNKQVFVSDEFEKSYYNAMLGSICDGGKYCTYNTPMSIIEGTSGQFDGNRVASQVDSAFQFDLGSPDMNCCQANFARGLGEICRWVVQIDNDELYLNHLAPCEIQTQIANENITLKVESGYPINGKVKLRFLNLEKPINFGLNIRIPSWVNKATCVFGENVQTVNGGKYLRLQSEWNNLSTVEIGFDISARAIKGEREQSEFVSVYYGPILLALDTRFSKGVTRNDKILLSSVKYCGKNVNGVKAEFVFEAKTNSGKTVALIDFASAGVVKKGEKCLPYYSWIKAEQNN